MKIPSVNITRKRISQPLVAGLIVGLLSACSPMNMLNQMVPEGGYDSETGISYGPEWRQKLDVYEPAAGIRTAEPVVVFFYGGSWKRGERGKYRFVGQSLSTAGYTVVIPDYRLYPAVRFPSFIEDGALAVRWAAEAYPDRPIVVMGHSAGAHIAAFLALDDRYVDAVGVERDRISGLVGLAGPYAFDPSEYNMTRPIFASAPTIEATKPVNYVTSSSPPAVLIHGADDRTVYPINSETLAENLRDLGVAAELAVLPDTGHIGVVLDFAEPFRSENGAYSETISFLNALDDDVVSIRY